MRPSDCLQNKCEHCACKVSKTTEHRLGPVDDTFCEAREDISVARLAGHQNVSAGRMRPAGSQLCILEIGHKSKKNTMEIDAECYLTCSSTFLQLFPLCKRV